jgi:SLOG in TRPM, prokaryote
MRGAGVRSPLLFDFPGGARAQAVDVGDLGELSSALTSLGLSPPRLTVVVVGGAGRLDRAGIERLRPVIATGIVPVLERLGAAAVDGGTLSGVMRMLGEARWALGAAFPLVGVVAEGTVEVPGRPVPLGADAVLEPHHSHFLIVPGDQWGAEAPWIAHTATVLAGAAPSITVLINGGEIAYSDIERSLQAGRRVAVIAGSGRTADVIASALAGTGSDERAWALTESGLVSSVPVDDPSALAELLAKALGKTSAD